MNKKYLIFLTIFLFLFLAPIKIGAEEFDWTVTGTATERWMALDYKYSGYICYNCFGTDSWECPSHPSYQPTKMINPYGGDNDGLCGCPTQLLDSPQLLNSHDHTSTYYCEYKKETQQTGSLNRSDSGSNSVEHQDKEKIIKTLKLEFTQDPRYQGGEIIDVNYKVTDTSEKILTWISENSVMACTDTNRNSTCDYTELAGDSDLDGVSDEFDKCLGTLVGCLVDNLGCSIDSDNDGVCNGLDCDNNNHQRFPGNLEICGDAIDQNCSGFDADCPAADNDWDGVSNQSDNCPETEFGCLIDSSGCLIDSDSDGKCDRATPFYFQVTAKGSYPPITFDWTVEGTATETYKVVQQKYSSSICYWCFGSDNWICPDHSAQGWIVKEKIRLPHPGSDDDYCCGCPAGIYDSYPGVVDCSDTTTAFYCKYEKLVDTTQTLSASDSGTAIINPDGTLSGETSYVLDFAKDSSYKGGQVSNASAVISVNNLSVSTSLTKSFSGTILSGDIKASSSDAGQWSDFQIGSGTVALGDKNKLIFVSDLVAPYGGTVYSLDYLTINREMIYDNDSNDRESGKNSIEYRSVIVWITGNEIRASANYYPPLAFIDEISPLLAKKEETISFFGHGEDRDGIITGYNWESHLDGFLNSQDIFQKILSLGTHLIRFIVQDNDEQRSPEANEFVKVNSKPIAYIDSVPDVVIIGEPAVFAGKGVDSDGYAVEHEWTSDIDGKIGSQSFITVTDLSIGIHAISYRVKDNDGEWSKSVSKKIIVRRTPVIFAWGFQLLSDKRNVEYYDVLDPLNGNQFKPNALIYFDNRDLKESAGFLDEIVEEVKSRTGSRKVDIVTHSTGGLISRWFVQFGPRNDVRKMILIGGPNHGSDWAYLGDWAGIGGEAVSQIEPHSLFLNTLNNNDKCATYGEGIDQWNRLVRYHVISGEGYPTPAHEHLDYEACFKMFGEKVCPVKFHKIIPWVTMKGDGVVAVRSAYLSDVPSDERQIFHLNQNPNHPEIFDIIKSVLTEDETSRSFSRSFGEAKSLSSEGGLDYSGFHWIKPFAGIIAPEEIKKHEFEVDSTVTDLMITSKGNTKIKLFDPDGIEINSSQPGVEIVQEEEFLMYNIQNPKSGIWIVLVSSLSDKEIQYLINAFLKTPLFVSAGLDKDVYKPGEPIVILGFVQNGEQLLPGAIVRAEIKKPDGTIKIIELSDNGDNYDLEAHDGIYTNTLSNTSLEGNYGINVKARINFQGNELERSVILNVPVEFFPDLVISPEGITFSNPDPTHGEFVTIDADIINIGEEDAKNVEVLFFDRDPRKDGKLIGKTVIDEIVQTSRGIRALSGAESKKTASIPWIAEYGNHNINVVISPYGSYLDGDYSNNKAEKKILTSDLVSPEADAGQDQKVFVNSFVKFDASRSSDNVFISTYNWDIDISSDSDGDGIIDNDIDLVGLNPILESGYPEIGIYTVQLSVDDQAGNGPIKDTVTITVTNKLDMELPVADAGVDIEVIEGRSFKFNGKLSSDNYAVTIYQWDIDLSEDSDFDGIADNDINLLGPNPEFIYHTPGNYGVGLTIDDAVGNGPVSDYLNVNVMVAITDRDNDSIRDTEDNCPDFYNPDQTDSDIDEIGDSCDPMNNFADPNRDCKVTVLDLVFIRNYLSKNPNINPEAKRADVNSDGKINILDLVFVRNNLGKVCK